MYTICQGSNLFTWRLQNTRLLTVSILKFWPQLPWLTASIPARKWWLVCFRRPTGWRGWLSKSSPRRSLHPSRSVPRKLFPPKWTEKWAKPGHFFVYFRSFHKTNIAQICLKVNDKSVDGVLGTRTQGGRMIGIDESTKLWRHPIKTFNRCVHGILNLCAQMTQEGHEQCDQ